MSDKDKLRLSGERQWCIVCGQPRGSCAHVIGFTTNIAQAYKLWKLELKRQMGLK